MSEHPNSDKKLDLALTQKAINDTIGPEGLVPSALIFGKYPQVWPKSERQVEKKTSAEIASMATTARGGMEKRNGRFKT